MLTISKWTETDSKWTETDLKLMETISKSTKWMLTISKWTETDSTVDMDRNGIEMTRMYSK